MDPQVASSAKDALQELLDVSPQLEAAVLLTREGQTIAHSLETNDATAESLGGLAVRLREAADQSRTELGREPVTQCEVATGDGHVFLVLDAERMVLAVTTAEPTVGLVFYDLKTALRSVREAVSADNNGAAGTSREKESSR